MMTLYTTILVRRIHDVTNSGAAPTIKRQANKPTSEQDNKQVASTNHSLSTQFKFKVLFPSYQKTSLFITRSSAVALEVVLTSLGNISHGDFFAPDTDAAFVIHTNCVVDDASGRIRIRVE